jgi:4-hydroxy-2-oxoheptanedioate aldolase
MTTMVHELIFMSQGRTIPFVRVPGHDHAAIGYALDAGASIIIPQVDTVAQAKHVVSAAKFGTKYNGTRSAPPFRLIPGLTDTASDPSMTLHDNLNHQAAIMIQIESLEGITNLDAILTEVPDIDAVWLGTLDARISMNLPGNGGAGGTELEWVEAVAKYQAVMKKHNKALAGFALGPDAMSMAKGYSFVMGMADVMALMGTLGTLAELREAYPARTDKVIAGEGAGMIGMKHGGQMGTRNGINGGRKSGEIVRER